MRAAVLRQFGAAEQIQVEKHFPVPIPGEKQVLVRVHAAGVNPVDTYIRSGVYAKLPSLPYTPGREGAGTVEAVGPKTNNVRVGDRVWFNVPITGSCAEFAITSSDLTYPLPEKTTFAQGATLGIAYTTAYRALFAKAGAQAGQNVFIHGISGGVGLAATQLAKAHGLRVFGTSSTDSGAELAKASGAEKVYNHGDEGYLEKVKEDHSAGFDIILEMLANVNLESDMNLVSNFGKIVVIGSRGKISVDPRDLMQSESSVIGLLSVLITVEDYKAMAERLNLLLEQGHISPIVTRILKLEDIVTAHKDVMDKKGGHGKIVISLDQPEA